VLHAPVSKRRRGCYPWFPGFPWRNFALSQG
jgi:hypothetical protein